MKKGTRNFVFCITAITTFCWVAATSGAAQTFITLYSFSPTNNGTNIDGKNPYSGLLLSGDTLYGTTHFGGVSSNGSVFSVKKDGTGFTNLHSFTAGSDGGIPDATLILAGNRLYGTTQRGGGANKGVVYSISTNGLSFMALYSFTATSSATNSDGAIPGGPLVLIGPTLYGTARLGGNTGNGTLFAVRTNGANFTNFYNFSALTSTNFTNYEGSYSLSGLTLAGGTFYGTAQSGGSSGKGTVFAIRTNGTGMTNLHSFAGFPSDGGYPMAGLVLSGSTLYGTANIGGSFARGTIFSVNTNGTGFTNLYHFKTVSPSNVGGANPVGGLVLSGETLYGTASSGGSAGKGTVFAIKTNGTGFTTLYNFNATSGTLLTNSDGANPWAGLVLSENNLYGVAVRGGNAGNGTVFNLTFPPRLTVACSTGSAIYHWPTNFLGFNYAGYALQSTANLLPPIAWNSNFPAPVIINGQYTITNPISGTQQFFRLSQ